MQSEHDQSKRDNLSKVPEDRICGAKTRAGTPCKNWGMWPSGRCRMHGGKSYGGAASPTFEHGWYSRYWPYTIMRKEVELHERAERRAATRLDEIRAKRAQQEAREKAKAEQLRRLLERDGGAFLLDLCTSEHGPDDDEGTRGR